MGNSLRVDQVDQVVVIVRRVSKLRYRVPAFIYHNREMFGPYLPTQKPRVGNEAMGGSHLALIVREINRP
jgi:hypothetical protein